MISSRVLQGRHFAGYFIHLFFQVVTEEEHSQNQGNPSPAGSAQSSPRRVRSETLYLDRAVPLLRKMRQSQSLAFERRLAPEPKPTLERFLESWLVLQIYQTIILYVEPSFIAADAFQSHMKICDIEKHIHQGVTQALVA